MCMMTSAISRMYSGEARLALLKQLLRDASPRNPTYVLGRIVADFRAQTSTELSVRCGEEVFILFEINEWAFATLLSNTSRRGYVPLDFCDVVKDFYEATDHGTQAKSRCSKDLMHDGKKMAERCSARSSKNCNATCSNNLGYYETKHKPNQVCKQSAHSQQRVDNLLHTQQKMPPSLNDTPSNTTTASRKELYAEQTTPSRGIGRSQSMHRPHDMVRSHDRSHDVNSSSATEQLPGTEVSDDSSRSHDVDKSHDPSSRTACCCCCEKRLCHRSRQEKYDNVLHYLRDSHVPESQCEDTESGLGDSESVLSFTEPHSGKTSVDLSDMSTQTSQSLENLQKQLGQMSAELDSAAQEIDIERACKKNSGKGKTCSKPASTADLMTSPQPSVDSLLDDSLYGSTTTDDSTLKSDDTDEESTSSFDREDYDTVRRRESKTNTGAQASDEQQEDHSTTQQPSRSSLPASSTSLPHSTARSASSWKSLSLPIMEKGKMNRVELTQLSAKIIDKLKPTRDELLHNRSKGQQAHTTREASKTSRSEASKLPSDGKVEASSASHKVLSNIDSVPATPPEIRQREMTLQSIQEQYMKLEEARLLHNALKHLNDTMHASEAANQSTSS